MNPTTSTLEASPESQGQADPTASSGAPRLPSQVVSFHLGREEYGLDIMRVQEIILMGDITQIPEVPAYIRGLINLRGKVIPIVDLRRRFGLDDIEPTEQTRIIVVNTAGMTFGVVVDAVNEVLRIEGEQLEPPPAGLLGGEQHYILGLLKRADRITILLDPEALLSEADRDCLKPAT
ncbi:MAG: chemotaxis protein CheW [Planctomycetota bacterium]|nr:MAG: chemotaxis protein CheW [Planctomycetota bacterium]